jgi:hypothetical protein
VSMRRNQSGHSLCPSATTLRTHSVPVVGVDYARSFTMCACN